MKTVITNLVVAAGVAAALTGAFSAPAHAANAQRDVYTQGGRTVDAFTDGARQRDAFTDGARQRDSFRDGAREARRPVGVALNTRTHDVYHDGARAARGVGNWAA